MKLNLILGKKQIVLASLVLILGAAIYLNYSVSKESSPYDITAGTSASESDIGAYGEAQLTDAKADETFTEARLERKKARDEAVETLATTLKDTELTDEEMVKTEGLDAEQAAQIKNIILEETGVLAENISVGEVP